MTRWLAMALLLCGSARIAAQPQETTEPAPAPPASGTRAPEEPREPQPKPGTREDRTATSERFDPSEKITEDLSVSYPTDI